MGEPIIKEKFVDVKMESFEIALHLEKVSENDDGSWSAKCTTIVVNGLPKEGLVFNKKSDHYLVINGARARLVEISRTGHRITEPDI